MSEAAIASAEAARALLAEVEDTIEALSAVMAEETALVRAGKLKAASALAEAKGDAARRYAQLLGAVKREASALDRFAADAAFAVRKRHAALLADLKTNLAVLATARSVAEGLVRSVASAVGAATGPSTYGVRGAAPRPGALAARGIAVNRSL